MNIYMLCVYVYLHKGEENNMFGLDKEIFKKSNKYFFIASVSIFFAAVFQLINPIVVKLIIDFNIVKAEIDDPLLNRIAEFVFANETLLMNLLVASLIIIGFSGVRGILLHFKGKNAAIGAEIVAKKLKDNLFSHIQELDYKFHVNTETGDLIQRATSDVETIRKFLANQLIEIVRAIFLLIVVIMFMISLSPKLTLYALSLIPIIIAYSYFFFKIVKKGFVKVEEAESEFTTVVQENLSGVKVVRAFNRKAYEKEKFDGKNRHFKVELFKLIRNMGFYWGISDFLCFSQVMIIVLVGLNFVVRGEITVGTFVAFVSYGNMIIWPVRMMGRLLTDFGKAKISGDRINEILTIEKEENIGERPDLKGFMKLDDIHFSYGDTKVLKGVNMEVKPGQMIGIVGPTGSGKTTLANILIGMLKPDQGHITIDGIQLSAIDKKYLRKQVSLVMQNTFLFAKTIEENIKISNDHLNREEVERAAKISSIHESIVSFEQGYETLVGEKGVSLSGGQKQRVSIARKIIEDSRILIFDDSLSAVDTDTEIKIIASLNKLKDELGMILISHRITSVMDADVIYVLEDGVITDSGTHSELKAKNNFYKSICDVQEADYREVQNV